jgi:hypothetical protein
MLNLLITIASLQGPQSVYHISAKVDIPVTLGAALASAVPNVYSDRLIKPRCPCDPAEVNAFDRGAIGNQNATAAKLSDVTVGVVIVAPLALDAIDLGGFNEVWWEDAVVFAQTLAINSALVTAAKYIAQRPLPRTYAGDPSLIDRPEGYRSFYSGHTSLVFAGLSATAMTIRLRYGEKTWPWVLTGVVGTSVAIERVAETAISRPCIVGAVAVRRGDYRPRPFARRGGVCPGDPPLPRRVHDGLEPPVLTLRST